MLSTTRSQSRRQRFAATLSPDFWQHFYDPASLTVKLKRAAKHSFAVHVICQGLVLVNRSYRWRRHVKLLVDDQVWIEAYTDIPWSTLQPAAKHLLRLPNRAMGEYLFRDPQLRRSAFTLSWCQGDTLLPMRQSCFHYRDTPIQLREIFYPAAIAYFFDR